MKICAVICEFNPFHNGHEYILRQARQVTDADCILALMSGNFVQRGFPAVIDAYERAKCALSNGADIVLELPSVYSVASADKFAVGAVNILRSLPVTHLSMGVESDGEDISVAAKIRHDESHEFTDVLKSKLKAEGYAKALTAATAYEAARLGKDENVFTEMLSKPNNILAVAYKKALLDFDSDIKFVPIPRIGGEIKSELSGKYSSASAIRNNLGKNDIETTMPKQSYDILMSALADNPVDSKVYSAIMLYALKNASTDDIANTPDCAEGFEHKIKELATRAASYDELLSGLPTSRFTRGRIMRICVQTLLGITKKMQNSGYAYSRLLGIKRNALKLLGSFPDSVITNKQSESAIAPGMSDIFEIDKRAWDVYSVINGSRNKFYGKLTIVD